jgi:hypothetical protein
VHLTFSFRLTHARGEVEVAGYPPPPETPRGDVVRGLVRADQLKKEMALLYQKGVADNLILNAIAEGRTVDNAFSIHFVEPLNFSDSTIKLAKGWAALKSHSVTGPVTMKIIYSLRGLVTTTPEEETQQDLPEAEEEEEEEEFHSERAADGQFFGPRDHFEEELLPERLKRVNPRTSPPLVGKLPGKKMLKTWIESINILLNK